MEIPSLLYIQALAERIDLLTSYISGLNTYQWLTDNQCVFIDGFILYDRKTRSQLEFDVYHINGDKVKDSIPQGFLVDKGLQGTTIKQFGV